MCVCVHIDDGCDAKEVTNGHTYCVLPAATRPEAASLCEGTFGGHLVTIKDPETSILISGLDLLSCNKLVLR